MKTIPAFVFFLFFSSLSAQTTESKSPLTFSGYIETYYSYDFQNPPSHEKPSFLYNFNRHNEVNINLGFIKANYSGGHTRANLSLMAGTYAQYNLSAEQGLLKNIMEANVGIRISRNKNLWIDAGIMPSHIGFESAIGKDCWNLTRSLQAENSPYYETGAKITYATPDEKWSLSALYLNGWQRIRRTDGNNTPAFGHQLTYKSDAKVTLNSSSFIGNDKPDSVRQMRYFHNFYAVLQLSPVVGATLGFDLGAEKKAGGSNAYTWWYSPQLIIKVKTSEKSALALRSEYYSDPDEVIVLSGSAHGFNSFGYSLNYDYTLFPNVMWRSEIRCISSKDPVLAGNEKATRNNFSLTTSLAISI
jgi:hypothetical protein